MSGTFQCVLDSCYPTCVVWKLLRAFCFVDKVRLSGSADGQSNTALMVCLCRRVLSLCGGNPAGLPGTRSTEGRPDASPFMRRFRGAPFLHFFPAFPRSPARLLSCALAGTARLCFAGSSQKKSPAQTSRGFGPAGGISSGSLPQSATCPWEQAASRRFAHGCPE